MSSSPQIISRRDARLAGRIRYYTGKPCPLGHVVERYVSCGLCILCSDAKKLIWLEKNKDRAKAYRAEHYEMHKHAYILRAARWRQANPEKANVSAARSRLKPGYPEQRRRAETARRKADPEKFRAAVRNRRAQRKAAPGQHTRADIEAILKAQKGRCAGPGCRAKLGKKYEIDHIIPIARGGSNDARNLQALCTPCNRRKSAKHPIEFARQAGLLL